MLWKMEHLLQRTNVPFSVIFSKLFKILLKFFLNFSMLSKNRKWCHDLKIAYGVKGLKKQRKIKQSYLQGVFNIHTCITLFTWLGSCAFSCQSTQTHSPFQWAHKCAAKEWKNTGQRSHHQGNHSPRSRTNRTLWNKIKQNILQHKTGKTILTL